MGENHASAAELARWRPPRIGNPSIGDAASDGDGAGEVGGHDGMFVCGVAGKESIRAGVVGRDEEPVVATVSISIERAGVLPFFRLSPSSSTCIES
ncbi:hypothetical protein FRC18_011506 [Serendipita sp. 400]|nr:hypothetical protein FRC18_011506 [Serendipita sp. 400]